MLKFAVTGHLLTISLVAAVALMARPASSGWSSFFKGKDPSIVEFDKINERLVDALPDNSEPTDNLLLALKWLQNNDPHLDREALVRFTSLLKLWDPDNNHCNLLAYDILKNNEASRESELMLPDSQVNPLMRIDQVIRDTAIEHADKCHYIYPRYFVRRRQETGKEQAFEDIKRLCDGVIRTSTYVVFESRKRETDERTWLYQKSKGASMTGPATANSLLEYLRFRCRNDPDGRYLKRVNDPRKRGKWMVAEDKVKDLFDRYAASRCDYLVRAFGHIFKPAMLDQCLYEDDRKYRAVDEANAEMMIWLQYYRLCDEMVGPEREKIEKELIQSIWDN